MIDVRDDGEIADVIHEQCGPFNTPSKRAGRQNGLDQKMGAPNAGAPVWAVDFTCQDQHLTVKGHPRLPATPNGGQRP
jgi:hypothetical protein